MQRAFVLDKNKQPLMPCHRARARELLKKKKATVPSGKNKGTHFGRVAVRSSGNFNIKKHTITLQGIPWRHCQMLQASDGYNYLTKKQELRFLLHLNEGVSALEI